jgi:hypothetical protein
MKEAAAGAAGAVYADTVRRLFDLDEDVERGGDDPPAGQPR